MAMPDGKVVEVEFTAGTWTDVTAYVDWTAGGQIRMGRTSQYSTPSPATLSVLLFNEDGRFTPLRQTLVDGTAHPYWPNVTPRRRIRYGFIISGTTYYRFVGYIKGWPPLLVDGRRPRVQITASSRDDRLGRVKMKAPIRQEIELASSIYAYWPCTDPDTATAAADASGETGPLSPVYTGAAPVFGGIGPGVGDGTGVAFAPTGSAAGQFLAGASWFTVGSSFAIVLAVNIGTALPSWAAMHIAEFIEPGDTVAGRARFSITSSGFAQFQVRSLAGTIRTGSVSLADGGWHSLTLTHSSASGDSFAVDGVAIGSNITTAGGANDVTSLRAIAGDWAFDPSARLQGSMGQVAVVAGSIRGNPGYDGAVNGYDGELLSTRVTRFLSYGGVPGVSSSVDTSTVVCGTYPQDGKDILSALQDMATTEGGGSVFYVGPDGLARFTNRTQRKPVAATLTVDAGADLDGGSFTPAYDDSQIINQVTGTRATSSSSASSQTVDDATSQATFDLWDDSFTSYAQTDADVLHNAQDRLASQKQPAYRLGQLPIDLATATTAGLYVAVAATDIGDRATVTNIYAAAAPASTVDVIIEGWTETFSSAGYMWLADTSPADNPRRGVWGDGTTITDVSYGRWQASTDCALNASITNTATTVVIKNPTGPTFTTNSAMYPLNIQIGAEIITLNSAPGGSTSPQTFTGVTRGAKGTTAAAQTANASVTLWPITTWTL